MIFDFWVKKCSICKRRVKPLKAYINDHGDKINVCISCREYAERRAFRKL